MADRNRVSNANFASKVNAQLDSKVYLGATRGMDFRLSIIDLYICDPPNIKSRNNGYTNLNGARYCNPLTSQFK